MPAPGWLNSLVGVLLVFGTVLVARGIGWCGRRFAPPRLRVPAAAAVGGGAGLAVGAGVVRAYFPADAFAFFLPFLGGFFTLVGAIRAGLSAAGVGARTHIRL